jgi:hypothetical protein
MRRAIGGTVLARTVLARAVFARTGFASTGHALTALAAGLLLAWPAGPAMAASASPRPATPASPRPATAASARSTARERFHLTSGDAQSRRQRVRAVGALTATGYALVGDFAASRTVSVLVFGHGRLRLVTKATSTSESVPNPATCKFTEVFKGSYVIHSGAGGYRDATGSGGYVSRIFGRLKKKSGSCGTQLASFWQSTRTAGSLHR